MGPPSTTRVAHCPEIQSPHGNNFNQFTKPITTDHLITSASTPSQQAPKHHNHQNPIAHCPHRANFITIQPFTKPNLSLLITIKLPPPIAAHGKRRNEYIETWAKTKTQEIERAEPARRTHTRPHITTPPSITTPPPAAKRRREENLEQMPPCFLLATIAAITTCPAVFKSAQFAASKLPSPKPEFAAVAAAVTEPRPRRRFHVPLPGRVYPSITTAASCSHEENKEQERKEGRPHGL
jgi:hypothetical protein